MNELPEQSPAQPKLATVAPRSTSESPPSGATAKRLSTAGALPAKPATGLGEWETRLTGTWALGSAIALSLLLTGQALFFRLPRASTAQVVAAREEAAGLAQNIADASGYQLIDQALLSNQVAVAESFLIPKRENVVGLVVEIEKLSRQAGWRPDLVVRASNDKSAGIDGAAVLPATLRLAAAPNPEGLPSSFERLITLLEQVDHLPYKVEVVSLSAVAEKDSSLSSAVVELQFWTRNANEKPPAK